MLKREEWQGFVRGRGWTPTYVDDEAIYPEVGHSGPERYPGKAWLTGRSPTGHLPSTVATSGEKESFGYAVKPHSSGPTTATPDEGRAGSPHQDALRRVRDSSSTRPSSAS